MRVIRSEVLGMCFGVRDALARIDQIEEPSDVTIHGELVHNAIVQGQLADRGFVLRSEVQRGAALPETPAVLITAHGVSQRERQRLEAAGKRLVDTTCPLVSRVHQAAQSLQAEGYHVLVIGRAGHVEVEGIVGDLDHFNVIESEHDVRTYPQERLGIICQTTATEAQAIRNRAAVAACNPHAEIKFRDTICRPTKEHQNALARLLQNVDAVVVVGGHNSNNTRALVARCRERGRPALHVQSAAELDAAWFQDFAVVGLTAGTSTPIATIDEVHRALVWIGNRAIEAQAMGTDPSRDELTDPETKETGDDHELSRAT
jgi:4-hydroxy-3-methylbut-2-enyl diphosphate reductase